MFELELREPERSPTRVRVDGGLEVGRETEGLTVDHETVSRRHARFDGGDGVLIVTDLGSTNGTRVDGNRISGPTTLVAGSVVRLGDVELVVLPPPTPRDNLAAAPTTGRPALDELASLESGAAVLRFRPGTAGERAAPAVMSAVKAARRRLAGVGSEAWGTVPQVCLVDPFPDPNDPSAVVTEGTVVDAARGEIWMVVTSESPAEPPGRPLALLFGASLPAAGDLQALLEGYGLWIDGAGDVDEQLRSLDLPPLFAADSDLRAAMALSFVRFLVAREGEDAFRRLLGTSQPGRIDAGAQEAYGAGLAALEMSWRESLASSGASARPSQFLRLSLRYLRPHKLRQAEIFVYMLLGLAFTTTFPFITRQVFDSALPSGRFSEVVTLLVVLGVAFFVSLLANLRRAYLTAYVGGAVVRDLRVEMFTKLQHLSTGWFTRHQKGDVIARLFSDVAQVQRGLSEVLADGFFQMIALVVSSAVMLRLNLWLGLLTLAGAPLVAVVYRAMGSGARKRSLAVQEESGQLISVTAENFDAQPVVKLFGLQNRERERFRRSSERLFRSERRLGLFGGLFGLSVNTIVTALRLGVLGFGAWLILEGQFTVGGLVAFMAIMGEVLNPVTVLTGIGQELQAATGALVRVNEILDEPPEVIDDPGAPALPRLGREVRLDGVTFSYSSERTTLQDIHAVIPAGTRVAFVGPSGSGKSTVLRLLMRLYDPDRGAVRFDGNDLTQVSLASLREQLGVVFQDTFLFDTTIRENIALGRPNATDAEVEAAARAAEIDTFADKLPRGYDTLVGEGGALLSGGQRQRVAIARALVRDPRVLLLDEATSALDPRTERQIVTTLERIGAGRTTIAITHRLTSVVDYDTIFVLVDGAIVESGTHAELLAEGATYARLWAEQTGASVELPTPPFDAGAALARVPLFSRLNASDLGAVAGRLRSRNLAAGERVAEGGGRLLLVARGQAQVMAPGLRGELVGTAELGPGDCFGLRALLGEETGAVLEALTPATVLELGDEALAGLAARYPEVGEALSGDQTAAVPAGGQRLHRPTIGPRAGTRLGVPVTL